MNQVLGSSIMVSTMGDAENVQGNKCEKDPSDSKDQSQ